MEIRKLREDESERAFYLGSQAFMFGSRDQSWRTDINKPDFVEFGVWDEAGLQAKATIIPFQLYMGAEQVVSMGGVAGVACLPASRGKGYAGTCLKYSLERMREAGQFISMLYPFSWEFYRKLGYEWVGQKRTYSVPTRILKPSPETAFVRQAIPADRSKVEACQVAFSKQYRGELVRTEKMWNRLLDNSEKEFTYTYLYERDGEVEGYLLYRGGKREETHLREFVTLTPRAQSGLLWLMKRMEMQIDKFVWDAPEDDLLWTQFYHWDVETKLQPFQMSRIVDVKAAFEALKPPIELSDSLTFEVVDETCSWNQGAWKVSFEGASVSIESTTSPAGLKIDIQALTQGYFGSPNIDTLFDAGRIEVHDESALETLAILLDGPTVWTNVFF